MHRTRRRGFLTAAATAVAPDRQHVIGDDESNQMLASEQRAGYTIA